MYYDISYLIFMLPAIILSMWAQFKVKSAYNQYSKIPNVHESPRRNKAHAKTTYVASVSHRRIGGKAIA